jgi:hypothetical protein
VEWWKYVCDPWLRQLRLRGWQRGGVGRGDLLGRVVDGGHGFLAEVAAFGDGPVVVLVEQDGADETDDGGVVGEDPDDVPAAFDLFADPLEWIRPAIGPSGMS